MPDRDLDITKFSYFAYRKLKKTLGEFDAVVECNEIAIREFIEKANKDGTNKYIQQLSHKHRVRVNEVDFLKFSTRIRQYYVASVFQQAEQFIKDFKAEWRIYFEGHEWSELKNGETIFQNSVRNLSIKLPNDLIEIYEYYRIVRNYMAHTDRDVDELKRRYNRISLNENEFLRDLRINVTPNPYDEIDFDDFLILTNVVKHIAYLFSVSSKPDNETVAKILLNKSKENGQSTFKGLKKLMNNSDRFDRAIKSFIKSTFGRFSQSDKKEIAEILKSLLA